MAAEIIRGVEEMTRWSRAERAGGRRIGFVPTMGYFHDGHLSLIRLAREACPRVVVSIFVNPTQFGPSEDFDRYPRDLARDRRLAEEAGAHALFVPGVEEIYPPGFLTAVSVRRISQVLCGAFRPGHFDGVALVVLKLLNIVEPDVLFLGEKDYQQTVVIRRMIADLGVGVKVMLGATVREADGLAMSSRNVYLQRAERDAAATLYRALSAGRRLVEGGERRAHAVLSEVRRLLTEGPLIEVEYVAAVDPETLEEVSVLDGPMRLAAAVRIGATRLIDNVDLRARAGAPGRGRGGRAAIVKGANLTALILAAGEGKRMRSPLPKVLHPVGGMPMVIRVIGIARRSGADRVVVVLGHGRDRVAPALAGEGVEIVVQEEQLGTGHAVRMAEPVLRERGGEVLILSGDVPLIRASSLGELVADHRRAGRAATVMTAIFEDPGMLGRIVRDERNDLQAIVEARDAGPTQSALREVNGGIYCFETAALLDALAKLGRENAQSQYYLTDTIEILRREGRRVGAWVVADPAEILGVNTPEERDAAERALRARAD